MNNIDRKSSGCFPLTDSIVTYVNFRRTHDDVHRFVTRKLSQWALSVPKYGIILQLYDHGSLSLTELSQLIFSANSNISPIVDRMERDGIVEKLQSESDKRVRKIRLTGKGLEIAPKIISEYRSFLHQMMMNCLSPEEQKTLRDLLNRLKDGIKSQLEAEQKILDIGKKK